MSETTLNAKDFYFMVSKEHKAFWLVRKDFWEKKKAISDSSLGSEIYEILPKGFHESSESQYQYYVDVKKFKKGKLKDGQQLLIDAGFEEIPNPWG